MEKLENQTKISPTKSSHISASSGTLILAIIILLSVFATYDKGSGFSLIQRYLIFAGFSTMLTAFVFYSSNKEQEKQEFEQKTHKETQKESPAKTIDINTYREKATKTKRTQEKTERVAAMF